MRFNLPSRFIIILASSVLIGNAECATISGTIGVESASVPLLYVVGVGGVAPESLVLFGNAIQGVSETWPVSDPEGAAAWVASLPNDAHRQISNISLWGGPTADPAVFNSALQLAMERWLALSGSGNTERTEFLDDDLERGRRSRGEIPDPDIAGNWTTAMDYNLVADPSFVDWNPVPEPSVSLLGILGTLGLLRRRR